MTAAEAERRTTRSLAQAAFGAALVSLVAAGCTRPASGHVDPVPTFIPQPTPDPTMREIIAGRGSPVVYLPPLEIRGSPTPTPPRGSGAGAARPVGKPTAPAAAPREAAPAAAPAPAPAPKPAAPAPAAAPKPAATPTRPAGSGSSGSGAPPSILNPSNVLPGGARPNPTPNR